MPVISKSWVNSIIVILTLSGCTSLDSESTNVNDSATETAFVNVSVVRPNENRVDQLQTVIVLDNRIAKIGPANKVKAGSRATIIDGTGLYLTPGLVEMHAHVPKAAQGRDYLEDVLFLWVANGITTIRNMNGEPAHIVLRSQLERQEVLGPRMYTAGPPFQGKKIRTATETGDMVAKQAASGYDFLKIHMALPLTTYDGIVAGANQIEMSFAGHVSNDIGLWRALEAGQKSIDHLDSYLPALVPEDTATSEVVDSLLGMPYTPFVDPTRIAMVAEATARAGVWNAPTLTLAENFVGPLDPAAPLRGAEYMPPKMVRGWIGVARGFQKSIDDPAMAQAFLDYRLRLVKALHEAGAGILLGSDAPQVLNVPGFSTHNELALLVESGLTPAEALTAGTMNAAIYFRAEDKFGRVKSGLSADLLLVTENPLDDISNLQNPVGVMLQGRWLTAEQIRAGLDKIAAKYSE